MGYPILIFAYVLSWGPIVLDTLGASGLGLGASGLGSEDLP